MITFIMCEYTDYVYLKLLSTSVTDGIVCLCFKTECTLTYRQKNATNKNGHTCTNEGS